MPPFPRAPLRPLRLLAAVLLAVVAPLGCTGDGAMAPVARPGALTNGETTDQAGGGTTPTLLACDPPADSQSTTALVDAAGGVLELGGTRVVIPANAVLAPTTFRLTIPPTRTVQIVVRAGDAKHFLFASPVVVTIDYGRCAGLLAPTRPVTAWHIDETTAALLQDMGGLDLRAAHAITFSTGHLSGYAVAD